MQCHTFGPFMLLLMLHHHEFSDCIHQSAANCGISTACVKMIDLDTYRQRIGGFNPYCKLRKRERRDRLGRNGGRKRFVYMGENQTVNNSMFILYYIYILYLYMLGSSATIYCAAKNCADSCMAGLGGA